MQPQELKPAMRCRHLFPAVVIWSLLLAPGSARADVFGCTVLLCMMNPQGWASVPACVQPVQTAFNLAARRQPWPQCPEANLSAQSAGPNDVDITGKDGTRRLPTDQQ